MAVPRNPKPLHSTPGCKLLQQFPILGCWTSDPTPTGVDPGEGAVPIREPDNQSRVPPLEAFDWVEWHLLNFLQGEMTRRIQQKTFW